MQKEELEMKKISRKSLTLNRNIKKSKILRNFNLKGLEQVFYLLIDR